jgi:hypothetical protein
VLFLDVVVESYVGDSDEVPLLAQFAGEMTSDEAAPSGYQYAVQVSFTLVFRERGFKVCPFRY